MPTDGPPSFQFYARDFLSSRTVSMMSPAAVGGYILLLCHAWLSDEPGTLPDDDAALAALSRLGASWPEHAAIIRSAFRQTTRGGASIIVQTRMEEERERQRNRSRQAQKGARVTNAARWTSVAQRPDSDTHSDRSAVAQVSPLPLQLPLHQESTHLSIGRGNEHSEPAPEPATNGPTRRTAPRKPDPLAAEWDEAFAEHFWPAYPRRVGRLPALKAWRKLRREFADLKAGEALLGRIVRAVKADVDGPWRDRETDKIPHPTTWLNQRRWEDDRT